MKRRRRLVNVILEVPLDLIEEVCYGVVPIKLRPILALRPALECNALDEQFKMFL